MELVKELESMPELATLRAQHVIELEPGEVGAILEAIVRDKEGRITFYKRMKSKSFVRQFLELLYSCWVGCGAGFLYSIRDTSNTPRNTFPVDNQTFVAGAAATDVTLGIIVGRSNAAPTVSDFALTTPCAQGVGLNQFQYSAVTFGAPANDASISQFRITRDFANGSGNPITVEECGLYIQGSDGGIKYFMAIRDVTGGIAVPNGQTLTLNYQIQSTV